MPTPSADVGSDADASTLTPTAINPTPERWNSNKSMKPASLGVQTLTILHFAG